MKYGYARVSTTGQNLETQIEALQKEHCDKIYHEKFTGTTTKRPKFKLVLKKLQTGDTLVVTKLDRFARNTKEALEVIQKLFDSGIKIHILNMGLIENTPTGKLIFTIFMAYAQFERDMILIRTQEGKVLARKNNPNYHEGRKLTYSAYKINEAFHLYQDGYSINEIAKITNISRSTIYRRFHEVMD